MKKSDVWISIAAYNEGKSISNVIKDLHKNGYMNIVVVDDGSKDATFEFISKAGAAALKHIINRGQGAALRTGINYSLLQGAKYVVTFDADGQHHAEEIESLLRPVVSGKYDVALGSRFLKKDSNTPLLRRVILKIGIIVVWFLYGIKLSDSHNGFRVFSREAAKKISITSDRMEHASQIVEEIHNKKLRYKEVPVTITYSDYSVAKGQSSWNSVRIGFRMLFRKLLH
jgi:polyprenyl-phospho-N-acetylgalactosaminyl synthase